MTYSPEHTYVPPAPQPETPQEPQEPQEPENAHGRVLELVEKVSGVAVPLAVGLYAMLYLGYQNLYSIFNITPEQAGLDQATIFARLLGTIVQVFLLLTPVVGLLVGLGWLLNKATGGVVGQGVDQLRERPWIAAAAAAVFAIGGYTAYFFVMGVPFLIDEPSEIQSLLIAVPVVLAGLLIPFRMMRRNRVGRAGTKVLSGVLLGIGLGFVLNYFMVVGAVDIHNNGNGNPILERVGFKNQWTRVMDGDGKKLMEGDPMMLLGEKEGAYVLYDCGAMKTIRRSIEGTILDKIELDPDFSEMEPCGYRLEEDEQPAEEQ
ncbi:hypothetical protein [Nonomuraea typhae]|uniref:Permease n=1 Tax=Nonomuraea typhae TaxID=2603600 RepID=A0ABW7YSU4_9ACTN